MNILDLVIDTKEAAEKWGLSQMRVKDMCQKGEIRAKKIGNSWAVDATQDNPKKYNAEKQVKKFYLDNLIEYETYLAAYEEREIQREGKGNGKIFVEFYNYDLGRHVKNYLKDYKVVTAEFVKDLEIEEIEKYSNEFVDGSDAKLYKIDDKTELVIFWYNEWHITDKARIINL